MSVCAKKEETFFPSMLQNNVFVYVYSNMDVLSVHDTTCVLIYFERVFMYVRRPVCVFFNCHRRYYYCHLLFCTAL